MTPPGTAALVASALVAATAIGGRIAARATRKAAAVHRLSSTLGRGPAPDPRAAPPLRIRRLTAPAWLPPALVDAGCDLRPGAVWSAWVAALVVAVLVAVVAGGPPLAALAGVVVVVAPLGVLHASRWRGPARVEAALPAGLEAVARAVRSGASLRQAVAEAGSTTPGVLGQELEHVTREASHGMPLTTALERLAARRPLPGVRLAVAALCLGAETGGAQAQAVDGVATTIRERLAVAAEARALASQARMSAAVIGIAPVGFGVFAASTDPRTARFLLHTSAGLALVVVGLVLDGLGWLWMQRLCRLAA